MTLIETMDLWLEEVSLRGTKTVELYSATRNLCEKFFGLGESLEITPAKVGKFVKWLLEVRGNCNNTARGRLKHVGIFYSWAQAQGFTQANPAKGVTAPALEKKEVHAIPGDWMGTVLSYVKEKAQGGDLKALRDLVMIGLLYGAGLRRGAVEGATWKGFNIKAGTLTVKEKGLITCTVGIPVNLMPVMVALKNALGDKGSEIIGLTGDGIRKRMKAVFVEAGLPLDVYRVSPHTLRHSFAVAQLLDGNDLKTVSKALHHSRISTTADFYTNLTESQVWNKVAAHNTLAGVI